MVSTIRSKLVAARSAKAALLATLVGAIAYFAAANRNVGSDFEEELVEDELFEEELSSQGNPEARDVTWTMFDGYISDGGDLRRLRLTVDEAKSKAATLQNCKGFTFEGPMTESPDRHNLQEQVG